jgi:hypothetical protein
MGIPSMPVLYSSATAAKPLVPASRGYFRTSLERVRHADAGVKSRRDMSRDGVDVANGLIFLACAKGLQRIQVSPT